MQRSWHWDGRTIGDASLAPYDNDTDWSDIWRYLLQADRTDQGIIEGVLNALVVSGAASPVSIATGAALVDGKFYLNDAVESLVVPTPAVSTRIDRVVLRKDWAAQTVRVARVAGAEGGGAPALTQSDGVTWEIPLAQVTITTLGAITLASERVVCRSPLGGAGVDILQMRIFN